MPYVVYEHEHEHIVFGNPKKCHHKITTCKNLCKHTNYGDIHFFMLLLLVLSLKEREGEGQAEQRQYQWWVLIDSMSNPNVNDVDCTIRYNHFVWQAYHIARKTCQNQMLLFAHHQRIFFSFFFHSLSFTLIVRSRISYFISTLTLNDKSHSRTC